MSSALTTRRVAPLLFGSGFCSLVYQVGWLRELRLVFGASTAASAAVLAIFIGGLGAGGLLLGRRADRARQPLMLYGNLEIIIAASAAVSPLLLALVRKIYIAAGGSFALGLGGGTLLRLVLAAVVLAIPTLAMGGTLAAATRAVADAGDARRRGLALLYGTNTLGAVLGAFASTFLLLEVLGTRKTIWVAALINALVALIARSMARRAGDAGAADEAPVAPDPSDRPRAPLPFVLAAAAVVGFAFFLMEMTWYRMLGPILGGTVFTFGLILAIALLGIGIGGLAYALRPAARPATVYGLVLTCVLEAIAIAIPLALGDRIAFAASALRTTSVFGFAGQVAGWAVIAGFVILPAAIISGIQFPLLVNLVGRGRGHVGRQLGLVYATNTIGAIAGSLLGGFVLLPSLGAVGCWRLAAVLLVALGAGALVLTRRDGTPRRRIGMAAGAVAIAILLVLAGGPTAAWRHGGIGAGRAAGMNTPADANAFVADTNRAIVWEAEGVESSVAIARDNGLSFIVNGKRDGNVQYDAATQMLGGMVGALIHPAPKRCLVIGLGTGETAGWLADSPGVERVDVIELEPAILEIARMAAAANRSVLANPKVSISIGDAREALLVSDRTYDVIFSEPSNPYRAGVASLYTREFYEAVHDRLGDDGLFLQWTQSYEVDGRTIATVYATLGSVFSEIHTFRLLPSDLLFVASKKPIRYDTKLLAERVGQPAVRDALVYGWQTEGVEGFLSHFLGDTRLAAETVTRSRGDLNTDDMTAIEFAFARSLGFTGVQNEPPLRRLAAALDADRPPVDGPIDWVRFDELRAQADAAGRIEPIPTPNLTAEPAARSQARAAYLQGQLSGAAAAWRKQTAQPASAFDARLVAESFAASGEAADTSRLRPAEAALIRARMFAAREQWANATAELEAGFTALRSDPFVHLVFVERAVSLARTVADRSPGHRKALVAALGEPFALYGQDDTRILARIYIAAQTDEATVVDVLAPLEPNIPWRRDVLMVRRAAYAATKHPLLERAEDDLRELLVGQPAALRGP